MDGGSDQSTSKEVELLSRVAANHLFLAQFEPLRAILLSLRNRDPELAVSILKTIVLKGGRFDGVLWSSNCSSPPHLAWMALHELEKMSDDSCFGGIDRDLLRLKIEFLLLAQTVCSGVQEKMDGGAGEKSSAMLDRVRWILELGFRGLKNDEDNENEVVRVDGFGMEEVLSGLREVILEQADVFDAICWNIHRQVYRCPEALEAKSTVRDSSDLHESAEALDGEFDAYVQIVKAVQMAHLNVMKEYTDSGDLNKAILQIRYLHPGFGVEELEYRMALKALIKKVWREKAGYEEEENPFQKKMLLVYEQSLSANSIKLTHIIQDIQDELHRDEIENNQHVLSDNVVILLPLKKYLKALKLAKVKGLDDQPFQCMIVHSCIKDMYQYARISGEHILESVILCALSAVKREQFEEACDVLSVFPLLQPLVAAMSWDLLSGKTAARRKLLLSLWTSKSQSLRLEEYSMYGKQSNEMSCVEYLCDLLCFHLDLASFVACTNSGHPWNSKNSMFFSRKQKIACEEVSDHADEFVENFVLERLAAQTPLRVLFDVVPELKFQDAIELISMQPMNSTSMAWKRLQDIELIHVRYALESVVLALGTMEKCVDDEKDMHYIEATWHLKNLRTHLASVSNIPRKVFTLSIVVSLLCMDNININLVRSTPSSSYSAASNQPDLASSSEDGNTKVMLFTTLLLDILHCSVQDVGVEWQHGSQNTAPHTGKEAQEWRVTNIKNFVEDWKWRLSILQNLLPLSRHSWSWKEALAVLRAAPSNLLNICIQRSKYDIREEAAYRFSLPPEDKTTLQLTGWVEGTFRRVQADSVSQDIEGFSGSFQEISSICSQLHPLVAVLLCIDIAATSSMTANACLKLLNEAGSNLSKIYPGGSSKIHSAYWDHLSEVAIISVIRRILQHLFNLLEKEKVSSLQEIFTGETSVYSFKESHKQRQHALAILHQIIDDAHKGKRQFLSGKLHNLSRVVADEEIDIEKKKLSSLEKGIVLGLGLKPLRSAQTKSASGEDNSQFADIDANDSGKMLLGTISSKPSTYISAFIVYIATIGNIVDGIDTTHDFNFFSLVYEWPKDLLTRLVFERGSTDAAAKIADIMCSDFVHEVIAACVPPVFPPHCGRGWASIPFLPSLSNSILEMSACKEAIMGSSISPLLDAPVFSLKLDIVKHLAKSSPVRAILACVFGSRILSSGRLSSKGDSSNADLSQTLDSEQPLYEFALDQSERFPTLNRWIQMLPNLHRVTEYATLGTLNVKVQAKASLKRSREPENDMESDIDDIAGGNLVSAVTCGDADDDHAEDSLGSPKSHFPELGSTSLLSLDWENEGSYEKAVERLICEGNLKDALAISDRFLRNGASDHLLQLLIEHGEEIHSVLGQSPSDGAHKPWSNNWQYCLRLKDKQLAAKLALKYLHHWEFNDAMDVLTMCACHLPQSSIRNEVLKTRQALKKYNSILLADDSHGSWQGVETEYKDDPEGLALKLAGRGAVSAALEVAESAALSSDLRRELQGRQLVNLLTVDPLNGGGPAQASRFLSSLPDPNDALPVAMSAMQLLPDLHSKQLLVHFFLKRRSGNLSDIEISRLNLWALGLHVLAELPLPWQQRCSALHEHPRLILEVLLMTKQLQYASLLLKKFPSLRDDNLVLTYSAKAIAVSVNSTPREFRTSLCDSRTRQKRRINISPKSNFTNSLSNLQKEARKALSWALDAGNRGPPKEADRKRKGSGLMSSERATCEAVVGNQEDRTLYPADGQERSPFVPTAEEWALTGDATKDDTVRSIHKYESAPDIVLFKGLLSLCSDELVSAKGAMSLCITQMKSVLSSQQLPLQASMEATSHAYHATEAFVQALGYAKNHLKKLIGISDMSSNSGSRDDDDASAETSSSSMSSQSPDELSDLLGEAEIWLGRAELLQSLLGSGIIASLDDIIDKESSACLRDRLIKEELYSMAVYTSKKCKVDVFPVWNAWGHALIRMEHYVQARAKFKQALQLHKGDPSVVIQEIIHTLESRPPIDASSVRCLYEHLAKSAPRIFDDSLSADAYLNILYMPSTFPRTERSRLFYGSTNGQFRSSSPDFEDGPRSNLDDMRYVECIYYFQEYDRPHMLQFMFQHGRYTDACLLFFPPNAIPLPPQPMMHGPVTNSPQRLDVLATDYGTIEDLCGYCIGYDAMPVLEDILSARISASQDATVTKYIASCLVRICNYCELHKHFNFLYKFQVIRFDHVGAGLCCIQLFMNSLSQEEAVKHLENAKMHFHEELSERSRSHGIPKIVSSGFRGKGVFGKFTEEGLLNLNACVDIQVDVIRSFNDTEGPQWTHSLFGNPSDPETFRRRCQIAETLAEKNFDLAFGVICRFNLPAVDIYAAVAAVLADKKRSNLLTLLFKNIRRTIDHDDWDQVLGAAINVYANKHKERPDKLIDMLNSSHRKVLACVVCGRLKSAFQIASRSGSVADVQYVAHQALHANALPVLDMCKQWLAQYS